MKLCGFEVGAKQPLFLIAGPCAIETESLALDSAETLKRITGELGIPFIYKSSFDKANRSSHESFRGVGLSEGLRILEKVRNEVEVPVLTDVHEETPMDEVADVVRRLLLVGIFVVVKPGSVEQLAYATKDGHQLGVDGPAREVTQSLLGLFLLTHRGPHVGVHRVDALDRLYRVTGQLEVDRGAVLQRRGEQRVHAPAMGLVPVLLLEQRIPAIEGDRREAGRAEDAHRAESTIRGSRRGESAGRVEGRGHGSSRVRGR